MKVLTYGLRKRRLQIVLFFPSNLFPSLPSFLKVPIFLKMIANESINEQTIHKLYFESSKYYRDYDKQGSEFNNEVAEINGRVKSSKFIKKELVKQTK